MKLFNQLHLPAGRQGPANLSGLLLYGVILLANIDYISIADYVIKAILGGAIWLGFHLLQEYYSARMKNKAKRTPKTRKPGSG